MVAYAFVGYFDSETESYYKKVWKDLSKNNITHYGVENKGKRPHITLADYNNLDKEKFINLLDKFYEEQAMVPITLNVLGNFIGSGTLFIAPALSEELSAFHSKHHSYFEVFNDDENSFYLPGRWSPHCTIASRLSKENMLRAFEYCIDNFNKLNGKISEVALIEVIFNDKGIAVEDNVIFSKLLR